MDNIDQLIEEMLVAAHDHDTQLDALDAAEESGRFPSTARTVGAPIEVITIEFEGRERWGIAAICRRDGGMHRVSLSDLLSGRLTRTTAKAPEHLRGTPP